MSFDKALHQIQSRVPDCIAVGVVELSGGTLLAGRDTHDDRLGGLEEVAALTASLFQGNGVSVIESLIQGTHSVGEAASPRCHEVVMVSSTRLHIFQRHPRNEDLVIVSICRGTVSVAAALLETRSLLRSLETVS